MHKTSINMDKKIYREITEVSQLLGVSKKYILMEILRYCHNNLNYSKIVTGRLTNYQKSSNETEWHCFRMDISDAECDIFSMYRYVFRISLSKLVAIGYFLFINEITDGFAKNLKTYNYLPKKIFYKNINQHLCQLIEDSLFLFGKIPINYLKT